MRRGDGVRGLFARAVVRIACTAPGPSRRSADGIFQASLASAVFFNPEHQTDPRQAAAGFVDPPAALQPGRALRGGPPRPVATAGGAGPGQRRARRSGDAHRDAADRRRPAASCRSTSPRSRLCRSAASTWPALSASLPHVVAREQLVLANACHDDVRLRGVGGGRRHRSGAARRSSARGDRGDATVGSVRGRRLPRRRGCRRPHAA